MKRREFVTLVCCAASAWPLAAFPQASNRRPLIAVLLGGSSTSAIFLASLIQGMEELGYVERRDFDVAARNAESDVTRMPALATELIRYKPAVFVTGNLAGTLAIKQTAATIPIVNPSIADPIAFGLVESLAGQQAKSPAYCSHWTVCPANSWNSCLKRCPAPSGC